MRAREIWLNRIQREEERIEQLERDLYDHELHPEELSDIIDTISDSGIGSGIYGLLLDVLNDNRNPKIKLADFVNIIIFKFYRSTRNRAQLSQTLIEALAKRSLLTDISVFKMLAIKSEYEHNSQSILALIYVFQKRSFTQPQLECIASHNLPTWQDALSWINAERFQEAKKFRAAKNFSGRLCQISSYLPEHLKFLDNKPSDLGVDLYFLNDREGDLLQELTDSVRTCISSRLQKDSPCHWYLKNSEHIEYDFELCIRKYINLINYYTFYSNTLRNSVKMQEKIQECKEELFLILQDALESSHSRSEKNGPNESKNSTSKHFALHDTYQEMYTALAQESDATEITFELASDLSAQETEDLKELFDGRSKKIHVLSDPWFGLQSRRIPDMSAVSATLAVPMQFITEDRQARNFQLGVKNQTESALQDAKEEKRSPSQITVSAEKQVTSILFRDSSYNPMRIITEDQLKGMWQYYRDTRRFWQRVNPDYFSVFQAALTADSKAERYKILNEYVNDKNNIDSEFRHILLKYTGDKFFLKSPSDEKGNPQKCRI